MSFDLRYAVFKVLFYIITCFRRILSLKSGSHLLSHTVSSIVPSAAYVFTVVFGMGTGVARKRIATGNFFVASASASATKRYNPTLTASLRKEVIQPLVLERLPC